MHRAAFRLSCRDAAITEHAARALGPELDDGPDGAHATVAAQGTELMIDMHADSLGSLRALMQGLVRLADAAIRVAEGRE